MLDGLEYTAWNTNLSGVEEAINFSMGTKKTIRGLEILNGYNKTTSNNHDLYWANRRAKTILIAYDGGSFEYTLDDAQGLYQRIEFDKSVTTEWVKITIKSEYYDTSTDYEDCCISEISAF